MEYVIENELLRVCVTTWGAQVKSVVRKCDGVEHMWQADPTVWGYHAPVLFPYCGKLKDGKLFAKGKQYDSPAQHGFARTSEHTLVSHSENSLVLELSESEQTLAVWPYRFRFVSTFTLDGDVLHHTLTVENTDACEMPFGVGFHPAFSVPFDNAHTYRDYELRFDRTESPLCLVTQPKGLVSGECYYLGNNLNTIPIDENLFANDSHCMTALRSNTLGLYEKDSGRAVVCSIKGFPFTLIWSKPGQPKFVCIEPWNALPSPEQGGIDWDAKPAAEVLCPGESFSTTLSTAFIREN